MSEVEIPTMPPSMDVSENPPRLSGTYTSSSPSRSPNVMDLLDGPALIGHRERPLVSDAASCSHAGASALPSSGEDHDMLSGENQPSPHGDSVVAAHDLAALQDMANQAVDTSDAAKFVFGCLPFLDFVLHHPDASIQAVDRITAGCKVAVELLSQRNGLQCLPMARVPDIFYAAYLSAAFGPNSHSTPTQPSVEDVTLETRIEAEGYKHNLRKETDRRKELESELGTARAELAVLRAEASTEDTKIRNMEVNLQTMRVESAQRDRAFDRFKERSKSEFERMERDLQRIIANGNKLLGRAEADSAAWKKEVDRLHALCLHKQKIYEDMEAKKDRIMLERQIMISFQQRLISSQQMELNATR